MLRRLGLLSVILVFFVVRFIELHHITEFALEGHEHDGGKCQIHLYSDGAKVLSDSYSSAVLVSPLAFLIIVPQTISFVTKQLQSFRPRAPPFSFI